MPPAVRRAKHIARDIELKDVAQVLGAAGKNMENMKEVQDIQDMDETETSLFCRRWGA